MSFFFCCEFIFWLSLFFVDINWDIPFNIKILSGKISLGFFISILYRALALKNIFRLLKQLIQYLR
jgi:hypothetical protein